MRVAILLLNRGRGSGVVAKEHASYLINQSHQVYYMHPGMEEEIDGAHNINIELSSQIMPVHEFLPAAKDNQKAVSHMTFEEAMAFLPAYENALEAIITNIDIVIGHHANLSAIATANVCRRHGKPYVLFLHGTGIEPRHEGLYDDRVWLQIKAAVKDANGIIVTTEYVRDTLVRNLISLPLEKFHIQACGVDLQEFKKENTGDIIEKYGLPSTYIICPGALSFLKGPQNVVEASKYFADLAPSIFIGDGNLREELEIKLAMRGKMLGYVSNEDKAKLINAASILVAGPEKKEHFGIIYIEAMAASTPVVAYEGGGVNSIITPDTGILTQRDPKALGEAVRSLLLNPKKCAEMGGKGRQRAEALYGSQILGPKLESWLMQILTNVI